ncbi:hypothetical protein VULLAG_LOCUS6854 [Vulpes lagopus]
MLLWPVALAAVCIPCLADMCLPFLLPHPVRVKSKELLLPDLHSRQACSTTTVSENSRLKEADGNPTVLVLGRPRQKVLLSLSGSTSLSSASSTSPENSLLPKVSKEE